MHPLRLTQRVSVRRRGFSGKHGEVIFRPIADKDDGDWYLRLQTGGRVIIDAQLMRRFGQQITIKAHDGTKCDIYEHIGVLRWFGLTGVEVQVIGCAPYYGRALELWQQLKPYVQEDTSRELPWYTPTEAKRWEYPTPRGGKTAYVELQPSSTRELTISASCSFKGIGELQLNFRVPEEQQLAEICSGYPAGLPAYRYGVGRFVSAFGWPHFQCVAWPQRMSPQEFLESVLRHRVLDALGALSLVCKDGLVAGHLTTKCAGHAADVGVVSQVAGRLRRI